MNRKHNTVQSNKKLHIVLFLSIQKYNLPQSKDVLSLLHHGFSSISWGFPHLFVFVLFYNLSLIHPVEKKKNKKQKTKKPILNFDKWYFRCIEVII